MGGERQRPSNRDMIYRPVLMGRTELTPLGGTYGPIYGSGSVVTEISGATLFSAHTAPSLTTRPTTFSEAWSRSWVLLGPDLNPGNLSKGGLSSSWSYVVLPEG